MPGAYHTSTDETHPVFHVFDECPEGSKIEEPYRVVKLKKRDLCKECVALMKQPTKTTKAAARVASVSKHLGNAGVPRITS